MSRTWKIKHRLRVNIPYEVMGDSHSEILAFHRELEKQVRQLINQRRRQEVFRVEADCR